MRPACVSFAAVSTWPERRVQLVVNAVWVSFAALGILAVAALSQNPKLALGGVAGGLAVAAALASPRLVTLLVLPAALLVPASVRLPGVGIPDITPLRLATAFALGIWLLRLVASDFRGYQRLPRAFAPVAGAFILYVLALSFDHGGATLNRGLGYSIEALVPLWLVWLSVNSKEDLLLLVDWLLILMAGVALLALREKLTRTFLIPAHEPFFFHAPDRSGGIRAQAIFPHPIVLGCALMLMLPVGVARLLTGDKTRRRPIALVSVPLMAAALFATESRGPWGAALVAVIVLAALMRGETRILIVAGLAALLVGVAFSPIGGKAATLVRGVIDPTSGQDAGVYTVQYRQQLWNSTLSYAGAHPLGTGPGLASGIGLWSVVGGNQTDLSLSIDNAYAKYLLEIGIVGFALFLALIAVVLRETWLARRTADSELAALASALVAAQVGMLIASATVATFTWAQLGALFWLLCGAGFAIGRLERQALAS